MVGVLELVAWGEIGMYWYGLGSSALYGENFWRGDKIIGGLVNS